MASTPAEPARGREAVEAALIDATCDLLAEFGPRATSVRDIAKRAGVNHAQVHHYFGGKRGLLMAAMRTLARDHHDGRGALQPTDPLPPPMAAPGDQRYWIAVVRATIEGDLELAGLEVADGVSVARGALEHLTEQGRPRRTKCRVERANWHTGSPCSSVGSPSKSLPTFRPR